MKNSLPTGKRPFPALALRLAGRELRGGPRGFGVFLACLFLGVFAISGVGSFAAAVRAGLFADARALLGGDLEIRLQQRELTPEQRSTLAGRGELSEIVEMRAMARNLQNDQRALVELKAVDDTYPLYGAVASDPALALDKAFAAGDEQHGEYGALAERTIMERLGLPVGGLVHIGGATYRIRGIIQNEPDRTLSGTFSLGPRLLVGRESLPATGLVVPGSLITYSYRLRMTHETSPDALQQELNSRFPEAGWRIQTFRQAVPRVRYFLDRMTTNLTLLGLSALLVGGLGVAGAVRGYLEKKILHIATMKCLGAPASLIFTTYLAQILTLGLAGAGLGVMAGAAMPYLIEVIFGNNLPFPFHPSIYPAPLLLASLFGLLTALAFSLPSLGRACRVEPSVLFRGHVYLASPPRSRHPSLAIHVATAAVFAALAGLALAASSDHRLALWFLLGTAGCFLVFRLLAALVITTVRKMPRPRHPSLGLGLANIHRPGSPAAGTIFSLGLGLTALVMVALVQANLHAMVKDTVPTEAPAFFFIDIQMDQAAEFDRIVHAIPGVNRVERLPTMRGRITAIDGVPVDTAKIAPESAWAVRGDRFISYTAAMPSGTRLAAGAWWPEDYQGPPRLSLTTDLAKGFGVTVGDTLTVNVLGREITAEIANLRQVEWTTFQLNFAILFAPGALEAAPQTYIATVHVATSGEEAVLRAVTDRFPNVSAITVREVLENVSRVISRIGVAFMVMAAVTLLAGLLVLAGAISADQHRRIHDAVIFKICGATRFEILAAFLTEFFILGTAAGLVSAIAGSITAHAIIARFMESRFTLYPATVLLTVAVGIASSLALGLAGTWKALGRKPAAYLRAE